MAFDTVIDKAALEENLIQIADIIREELGIQETIAFPEMFVQELQRAFTQKKETLAAMEADFKSVVERTVETISNSAFTSVGNSGFMGSSKLVTVDFPNVTVVRNGAFRSCYSMKNVTMPSLVTVDREAFRGCSGLETISLPSATEIRNYAFEACIALKNVSLPMATLIGQYAFGGCAEVEMLDLPCVTSIGTYAFRTAAKLGTLILRSNTVCTLDNVNAFYGTPFGTDDLTTSGTLYVPEALVETYKVSPTWLTLCNYGTINFSAIEGSEYE